MHSYRETEDLVNSLKISANYWLGLRKIKAIQTFHRLGSSQWMYIALITDDKQTNRQIDWWQIDACKSKKQSQGSEALVSRQTRNDADIAQCLENLEIGSPSTYIETYHASFGCAEILVSRKLNIVTISHAIYIFLLDLYVVWEVLEVLLQYRYSIYSTYLLSQALESFRLRLNVAAIHILLSALWISLPIATTALFSASRPSPLWVRTDALRLPLVV